MASSSGSGREGEEEMKVVDNDDDGDAVFEHTAAFRAAYAHLNALMEGSTPAGRAQDLIRAFKALEADATALAEAPLPPRAPPLSCPPKALDEAVARHLAREGVSPAAATLVEEAGVAVENMDAFERLGAMCSALVLNHDCAPAIAWCTEVRQADLVFQLRALEFMRLVEDARDQQGALAFAQAHFSSVLPVHIPVVQKLMGSLMFMNDDLVAPDSPYRALYSADRYQVAARAVRSAFCRSLNIAERPPLRVCLEAAAVAEPHIRRFRERVLGGDAADSADALPPVDLGRDLTFHSSLVCPITRQETTVENPPVRLECGHVVSREAFERIRATTMRGRNSFKCPYCPRVMNRSTGPFELHLF